MSDSPIRPLRRPRDASGQILTGLKHWISNDGQFIFLYWDTNQHGQFYYDGEPPPDARQWWAVVARPGTGDSQHAQRVLSASGLVGRQIPRLRDAVQALEAAVFLVEEERTTE